MNKQYITGILLSVLFFAGFLFVRTADASTSVCTDLKSNIILGTNNTSKESAVIQLQDFLHSAGYLDSSSTGYFGKMTFKAVQNFQTSQHLPSVGTVGPLTRSEIKKVSCSSAAVTKPIQDSSQTASVITSVIQAPQTIDKTSKLSSLPYHADTFSEWKGMWGTVSMSSTGTLILHATTTTSSVAAMLPDSKDWTDYKYTASVIVTNGNVMLIARKVDDRNLVSCTFSRNIITIQQRLNGVLTTLAETTVVDLPASPFFQKAVNVALRVKGNTIGCSALGSDDNLTYTKVDNSLLKGGIAIQSWFPDFGAATLELRSVDVVAI